MEASLTINPTKMTELKDSGLMAIEVPEDAHDFYLMSNKQWVLYRTKTSNMEIIKGKSKCDLIGYCTADEISFDPVDVVDMDKYSVGWRNYNDDSILPNPEESFRSLLTANGVLFVNPYGKIMPFATDNDAGTEREYIERDWQQAESKLVKKVLILKPINK